MGALPYKKQGTLSDGNPTGKEGYFRLCLCDTACFVLRKVFMKKLDFYYIDLKYIRYLSRVDDNIMSISPQQQKQTRPFLGIIVLLNKQKYCIPLTSPKKKFMDKKSQIDFIKIFDKSKKDERGGYKLIGVLNINNMIPVTDSVIRKIDLVINEYDLQETKVYKQLMQKQLRWCRENADIIYNRANKVYDLIINHPEQNRRLTARSSKFLQLEVMSGKFKE